MGPVDQGSLLLMTDNGPLKSQGQPQMFTHTRNDCGGYGKVFERTNGET